MFIYRIVFNTGQEYIGKLADDKILEAHSRKGYCIQDPAVQSSGEWIWRQDVIKNGMANQTFVSEVYYGDLTTIVGALNSVGLSNSMLQGLMQLGGRGLLEVVEALLILLSKKSGYNVGQQIDFLTREAQNVEDYVSVEEFERRKTAFFDSLINNIYLNFKKRKNPIIKDVSEHIENLLNQATLSSKRYKGTINLTKYPEVAKAITLAITKKTVSDIERQLRSKITNNNKSFMEPYINNLIAELNNKAYTNKKNIRRKKGKPITYGDLFSSIYDYITQNKEETLSNDGEAESRQAASDFLTQGIRNTSLSSILNGGNKKTPQSDINGQNFIKKRFTDEMSIILTNAIPYDPSYSDRGGGLETQIKTNGEQGGLSQYYNGYFSEPDNKNYTPKKEDSLMEKIKPTDTDSFVISNGPPIYAEQIILGLRTKHPDSFLLQRRDLIDGYKRDIESYTDIIYY